MTYSNNTLFIGKVLHHFDRIDSTNDEAQRMISKGNVIEGTVISTDFQTGGKGQRGNTWESTENLNLLMSLVLRPSFLLVRDQFDINQFVSLALIDLVSSLLPQSEVSIKWPNDIYIGDKKVAGILIQNILKGSQIDTCIIGIGLNVNQVEFSDLLPNPSSLSLSTGQEKTVFDVVEIKFELCSDLEKRYLQVKNNTQKLRSEYLSNLYAKDEVKSFFDVNQETRFTGMIRDIDETGKLVIEVLTGLDEKFKAYNFKEVQILE